MDEATATMMARMSVDHTYGHLLRDLALPADAAREVRSILTDHLAAEMRGMEFLGKEGNDWDQFEAQEKARFAELHNRLSQVLTEEELAAWEAYEADKERHILEYGIETELTMFGSSMDEESRQIVRDVLAEEMMNPQLENMSPESIEDFAFEVMETQAIARARERLQTLLSNDQFEQAEAFLQHKEELAEAMAESMRQYEQSDAELDDLHATPVE